MNGNGAYEDEMNEVALFETALRAAVPVGPHPELGRELVPRLAQVARAATIEAQTRASRHGAGFGRTRRVLSRRALVARVAIAVCLVPLLFAGLAVAGVTVPGPARDAFDSLGITLPNQPSEASEQAPATKQGNGGGGNDVSDAARNTPKGEQGNSAAAHRHAREQRAKARGEAKGHTRGKAVGLNDAAPPGQAGDAGPPEHSNAGAAPQSESAPVAPAPPPHPFPPATSRGRGNSG